MKAERKTAAWAVEYLTANAQVYRAFAELVDARRRDRPGVRLSADMVLHVVRWNSGIREASGPWKVNNDVSALLARVYEAERGSLDGPTVVFQKRRSWLDDLPFGTWTHLVELGRLARIGL